MDKLARQPNSIVISCELNLNIDFLIQTIWDYLALIRVYLKKPGNAPDLGIFLFIHHSQCLSKKNF